jgi:hypothetical protein
MNPTSDTKKSSLDKNAQEMDTFFRNLEEEVRLTRNSAASMSSAYAERKSKLPFSRQ